MLKTTKKPLSTIQDNMRIPIKFGATTLIGSFGEFPRKTGNCFSLMDEKGEYHRVVNFNYENLKEWMHRTGQTDVDVECIPKSDHIWMIADERIPKNWYSNRFCEVCTPYRLLPYEQRKAMFARTKVSQYHDESGERRLIFSTQIGNPQPKTLIEPWTVQISDDIEAFHSLDAEEELSDVLKEYSSRFINSDFYKKITIKDEDDDASSSGHNS